MPRYKVDVNVTTTRMMFINAKNEAEASEKGEAWVKEELSDYKGVKIKTSSVQESQEVEL